MHRRHQIAPTPIFRRETFAVSRRKMGSGLFRCLRCTVFCKSAKRAQKAALKKGEFGFLGPTVHSFWPEGPLPNCKYPSEFQKKIQKRRALTSFWPKNLPTAFKCKFGIKPAVETRNFSSEQKRTHDEAKKLKILKILPPPLL